MEKKFTLIILAIMAAAAKILLSWINVSHWLNTACNMSSNNPVVLPLTWFAWGVYTYTVWLNGLSAKTLIFWFFAVIGLAVNVYFTGCMVSYWL